MTQTDTETAAGRPGPAAGTAPATVSATPALAARPSTTKYAEKRLAGTAWRLGLVVAVAVAAFAAAVTHFRGAPMRACALEGRSDPSYSARLHGGTADEASSFRVSVSENGQPLADGQVCVAARPARSSAVGVSAAARPAGGGEYDLGVQFDPAGRWVGHVLVIRPGRAPVQIPISFSVRARVRSA